MINVINNVESVLKRDGVLKKTQIKTRLNKLSEEINKHTTRIENGENIELLEIHKLFYTI